METKKIPAQAVVEVTTDFGKQCLREIKGLKEGTLLKGTFNPDNNAFDFIYNGEDAMLWIGHDGKLTRLGKDQENDGYKYQMLDRLRQDCWYFIDNTHSLRSLYHHDVNEQIAAMRKLWNEVSIKPEWLTSEDIDEIESRMKEISNTEEVK